VRAAALGVGAIAVLLRGPFLVSMSAAPPNFAPTESASERLSRSCGIAHAPFGIPIETERPTWLSVQPIRVG